jgi:phosphoenolpyruvate carboxykinase (GTP)
MLPFCGYNMADYFKHWLKIGREGDEAKLPKIFVVNWFRKDEDGNFIWPGFGENVRVLDWIMRRTDSEGEAEESPIGLVPPTSDINADGLEISTEDMESLLNVDPDEVRQQLHQVASHLAQFGSRLPDEIKGQLEALKERLR